jgi:hypothetical protein
MAQYRVIPKTDTGLEFPTDFLLYDVNAETSRQILQMDEVEDKETGQECTALVVQDDEIGEAATMIVLPYESFFVVMGVEIEVVSYEGPAHKV